MAPSTRPVLFWTPRILGLLFAVFVSMFALDVFSDAAGFWDTLVALLMHLVPTAVLLACLAAGWRRDEIGAILYAALGIAYIVLFWGRFPWHVYAIMSGPVFLIAVLFLAGWLYQPHTRTSP